MAILIAKVVRSGAAGRGDALHGSSSHKSNPTGHLTSRTVISGGPSLPKSGNAYWGKSGKDVDTRGGSAGSEIHLATYPGEHGIVKTVETTVVADGGEDSHSDKS